MSFWIALILVLIIAWAFVYSIKVIVRENTKPYDGTKLKEWLNREKPIPKTPDLSFIDKMKRNRKYKPKAVIKYYVKKDLVVSLLFPTFVFSNIKSCNIHVVSIPIFYLFELIRLFILHKEHIYGNIQYSKQNQR